MTLAFSLPKDNTFSIYLNNFVGMVIDKFPKLTINGMTSDDMYHLSQGIHRATKGSVVVISDDNHYDIDWYPSKERAQRAGISNIYDITNDWGTVKNFLKNYYDKNYVYTNLYGSEDSYYGKTSYVSAYAVPYFDEPKKTSYLNTSTFVKVGNNIYPKYPVANTKKSNTTTIRIHIKKQPKPNFVSFLTGFTF